MLGPSFLTPTYPFSSSHPLPPDDCQELLNGWHNFSFELMGLVASGEDGVCGGLGGEGEGGKDNDPTPSPQSVNRNEKKLS